MSPQLDILCLEPAAAIMIQMVAAFRAVLPLLYR